MKQLFLFLVTFFSINTLSAQIPINDECTGALMVTTVAYGATCASSNSASTFGSTASPEALSCGISAANDDIWYSFVATSPQAVIRFSNAVYAGGGTGFLGYALYGGSCGSLTEISCDNNFGFGSGYKILTGLTASTTYYIRLYGTSNVSTVNFNFCIQDVPPAPINDDCAGAITIPLDPFSNSCTNPIAANTSGATQSSIIADCSGTSSNDDIWFKFTATSSQVVLRYTSNGETTGASSSRLGYAIYTGSCPTSSTTFACNNSLGFNGGYEIIGGFTIGMEYYLRLYSNGANNFFSFNFCVQAVPPPPANDECAGAITIPADPFNSTCTNPITANTSGATQSNIIADCSGISSNDDIWYKFTATSTQVILRYSSNGETTGASSSRLGYAMYEGSCPTSSTTFACNNSLGFNGGYEIIGGLTSGMEYYLRLYSFGANNFFTFDFCVQAVPPPPANDDCAGAITIGVDPFGSTCTNPITANTSGATQSNIIADCSGTSSNDDIWYKFTATSMQVVLRYTSNGETTGASSSRLGYAMYEGSCPTSSTTFACTNSLGFNGGHEIIGGLTVGTEYYLRLYSFGANNFFTFDFCVQEVPPAPANDECSGAIFLNTEPDAATCSNAVSVNTSGATRSPNDPSCTAGNSDDLWYTFIAPTPSVTFRFSNGVYTINNGNLQLGYALYNSCPATSATVSCSASVGFGSGSTQVNGLTTGITYTLRLFGRESNNFASFDFCIQSVPAPPANDDCSSAENLIVSNGFCTNPTIGNTLYALSTIGLADPSCALTANVDDVWYKVTIPATGNVIIQTSPINTSVDDLVMTAYSNVCGSLAEIACDDNGNPNSFPAGNHSRISFTGRTAGEIVLLRIQGKNANDKGQFTICAWDETISVLPAISATGSCTPVLPKNIGPANSNHYMWVPIMNGAGEIVAEFYADGKNVGDVNSQLFVNTSGTVRDYNGQYYLDRNLAMQTANTFAGNVKLRIYIKESERQALEAVDPTITSAAALNEIKVTEACASAYSGGGVNVPITVGNYGGNYYLQSDISSFSNFYFGNPAVLPIKIEKFEVSKSGSNNIASWTISGANDLERTVLERSADGISFLPIKEYAAANSGVQESKTHTDADSKYDKLYYRIVVYDITGKKTYSVVRIITRTGAGHDIFVVYPNPATDEVQIENRSNSVGTVQLYLYDATGKLVRNKRLSVGINTYKMDLRALSPGVYMILMVDGDNNKYRSRIIKQ